MTPEVSFHTSATAIAEEMIYVQDIAWDKKRGVIFIMKFESPRKLFIEFEKSFEIIKTSGYYAINENHENGLLFLQL
jgi:hypothetical protein